MTTLAKRIKRARINQRMQVNQLAKKIGCDKAYIYQLENQEFGIKTTKYLEPLAKALRVDAHWLLTGKTPQTVSPTNVAWGSHPLTRLCEEQQAKIDVLIADNTALAESKSELAEELEALRDENIALAKEAIKAATELSDAKFNSLVTDLQSILRLSHVTRSSGVESKTLQAILNHHVQPEKA